MGKRGSNGAPNAIDLFAGCGGLTSGLLAAGFNVVAAVEFDAAAAESYEANHPDVELLREDIRDVDPAELMKTLKRKGIGSIDLIAGCPPCQGFTSLTAHNGRHERRNSLVREYFRFVEVLQPKVCMLENVPGLFSTNKGRKYFYELTGGLKRLGYTITHDVLELADYGVPQFRKRLVLLATKGAAMELPAPTHGAPGKKSREPWRTVRDTIGGKNLDKLRNPPRRSQVIEGKAKPKYQWHYARDVADVVRKRLEHALKHGRSRSALPDDLKLKCHEVDGYYDVYGVMAWDEPSPTITSGCTNASKGRFGHPAQPRPLTAVEAALLQTFPLGYKFRGPGVESVAAQIGNALPRRFARIMGLAILRHLRADKGKVSAGQRKGMRSPKESDVRTGRYPG